MSKVNLLEETESFKPADAMKTPEQQNKCQNPDPKAESWATKNSWFGQDRPMTYHSV